MSDLTNGDKGFPRFLYSITSPNGKEMIVVRGDDFDQFKKDKKQVINLIPADAAFPDDFGKKMATPPDQVQKSSPVCPVHGTPMRFIPAGVSKTGKHYSAFYSCPAKNADGSYCKETAKG